ncbi:MAG: MarR family winged helix-turn-helix transcriptional regulator [Negativicutes bacterium]|nr:MarR family winged helix-turn-helix transcriptional regulator [Negativicutes bacterium]MDR3592810.1 MarR family winged helix-turn-helix transcriptional regulator [Negativicutes bacterium]
MVSNYRGTKTATLALHTYVKMMQAAELVTGRIHRHLTTTGLTITQFGVLEALYHLGPLCQRDIAAKILKSCGNITHVLDNLEKRGLVERRRDSDDRRYYTVHLTESGQGMMSDVFPCHEAAVLGEMAVLTPSEQREFIRLCRKLTTGRQ